MEDELQGRVQLRLADRKHPWQALPQWDAVSAGRTPGYGLYLPNSWMPRRLCRFVPHERGWLVQVGPRARMQVEDRYVGKHVFARRAMVALQAGRTKLSFPELDDWCQIGIVIGVGEAGALPVLSDTVLPEGPMPGTAYAVERVTLTPAQRITVAVAFRHLLEHTPAPTNYSEEAALLLGTSKAMVLKRLDQVRRKINQERWGPKLDSHELVAHYLMRTTRTITWGDLPPELREG
ncbi:hypothetical protein GGQ22_02725 [Nocardioides sp. zg-579]|uniref:Uncharacterized protein n=1 Tax=Nocardioides marmotae TaxID=2663857 RepID=A0A6I3IY48_9ACTN|nr:hypothetical protein [Nocardioides marmotae]MCR6030353.1 hypothetical protein [Gordonia jinghuaiqii]MTB93987.1 hypothetical protein [Nocardioides marmotae]QKE00302.1 hypothetical protein HPC71_03805 [Nocardioides marmotae]